MTPALLYAQSSRPWVATTRFAPCVAHDTQCLLATLNIDIGDDDLRSFLGEEPRGRAPDAGAATGD
jgi:hypothetical protein